MIVNAPGVVLSRRAVGEADRLCSVYTEELGRVLVRFAGVNKAGRKLKALSEPMAWAELRLYLNPRTGQAKCVGGQLIASFPSLRDHFDRTMEALSCCELLNEATAERSPNPLKYRLVCGALANLDARRGPWTLAAFGLRLLELAGHGLFGVEGAARLCEPGLWKALHEAAWERLDDFPYDAQAARRLRELAAGQVEEQTGRPLRSREFWRQMAPVMVEAA